MKFKVLFTLLCINGLIFGSSIRQSSEIIVENEDAVVNDDFGTPSTENEFPMQEEEVIDVTEQFMKKNGIAAV